MNENRLSPSGEESGPVELRSRDIVQFGVNVNVEKKGGGVRVYAWHVCLFPVSLCMCVDVVDVHVVLTAMF